MLGQILTSTTDRNQIEQEKERYQNNEQQQERQANKGNDAQ